MLPRVEDVLLRLGYPGLALLMFVESVFPPIPSELIMPFAGYLCGKGELSFPAPAGMMQMQLAPFLLFSALGGALWNTLLAAAGRALGQRYAAIEVWVSPAGYAVLAGAAGVYVLRVVRLQRGARR